MLRNVISVFAIANVHAAKDTCGQLQDLLVKMYKVADSDYNVKWWWGSDSDPKNKFDKVRFEAAVVSVLAQGLVQAERDLMQSWLTSDKICVAMKQRLPEGAVKLFNEIMARPSMANIVTSDTNIGAVGDCSSYQAALQEIAKMHKDSPDRQAAILKDVNSTQLDALRMLSYFKTACATEFGALKDFPAIDGSKVSEEIARRFPEGTDLTALYITLGVIGGLLLLAAMAYLVYVFVYLPKQADSEQPSV